MPLRPRAWRAFTGLSLPFLVGLSAPSCERARPEAESASQPSAAEMARLPSAATLPTAPIPPPSAAATPAAPAPPPAAATGAEPQRRLRLEPDEPALRLDAERFPGSAFFVQQILSDLAVARLHGLKPVGSTSTVFRASLDAPFRAAFKATTRARRRGPSAEVAAYRLARVLGLSNVPPATLRRVPKAALQRELEPRAAASWPQIAERLVVDAQGEVEGAAIFWIDGLRDLPIEERGARETALRALRQGEDIPESLALLLPQLSNLLVFDWLIGNTDRWSGANLKGDGAGQLLFIRDHDFAFGKLSAEQEQRLFAPLARSERYSRGLISRARALTPEAFERELAKDPGFARTPPRIEAAALAAVFARRDKLVAHIDGLVASHGPDKVLPFP